jgi:hypothetical protein
MKIARQLSFSPLIGIIRSGFKQIKDHRGSNTKISLVDAHMSAFAMFSLKDSSLLQLDERRAQDKNLKQIYELENIPCDTQMRTILDPVASEEIKPSFKAIFEEVKEAGMLEEFVFLGKYYLISLDGTDYFSSKKLVLTDFVVGVERSESLPVGLVVSFR